MIRELYKIVIGSDEYHYSNGDESVAHDGDTYEPETIGRTDMSQNGEMNRAGISIRVPVTNAVAAVYLASSPDVVASVTVFQDRSGTVLTYWKGRIVGSRATEHLVTLECESVFTGMRRTGARARYQIQCRHALYGTSCGVNKDNHATAGTIATVDGVTLTVTGADAQADGYWVGGMIKLGDSFRFIVGHEGTTIRLWRELPGAAVSDAVTLYPGCNRSLTHCDERFSNSLNFGGFPYLPNINPFNFVNIF